MRIHHPENNRQEYLARLQVYEEASMNRIHSYIKENWPLEIVPIDPKSSFMEFLGQENRDFLTEVGFPTGIEMIMSGLAADFISIPINQVQIIQNHWKYVTIAGHYLNYGCPIGKDKVSLYVNDAPQPTFVNSNLERMYYFIIKADEAMLEDCDYTFEELKVEFFDLESEYPNATFSSFWESIISWQSGEDDFDLDSEGNII